MTRKQIHGILLEMGIMPSMLGFEYVTEAVILILEGRKHYKIAEVYKILADRFNTSTVRIERNIRTIFKEKLNYELPEVKKYLLKPNLGNGEYLYLFALKIKEEIEEV